MDDSPDSIARDVAAVSRISSVPSMLRIVCDNTGMRFAAVARVTDGTWTACAVEDQINFGLAPGGQLDVHTTLCKESRARLAPVVFDHASRDPVYATHHTPRLYNIESYISVPILLPGGEYFGNLCAIDPQPHAIAEPRTVAMFQGFAELIGRQLQAERQREVTETALLDAHATAEFRDQFIAVLGHDLRNPLSSVGFIAEILARNEQEAVARYGQRLRVSTQRMGRLISDVLDFARGRLGRHLVATPAPVADLGAALQHVVAELRDAHPAWQIVERYALAQTVECDRSRIEQLLSNLVGNALSYGDASVPVVVAARVDAGWLELSVTNGGEPIAAGDLGRIFEPFWRTAARQEGGGLGLGLYICSQIVRAHGGTLQVSSSREAGTTFTARVPATAAVAD